MTKLWQKGYHLNEQVERFEAAQNSVLDARLIRHDVWGSLAHTAMLAKIGVLTESEHKALKDALCSILQLEATHEFTITLADEDVHTRVENYLVAVAGAAGKKIHMARSRNDQVLVDLRLYAKEQLHSVAAKLCHLCTTLLSLASRHTNTPMPGYTHMQRAMLSSVGLWAASFGESLLDDEQLLSAAYVLMISHRLVPLLATAFQSPSIASIAPTCSASLACRTTSSMYRIVAVKLRQLLCRHWRKLCST